MGHVRFAGRVTEEVRFGVVLGRCDVPQNDGTWVTRYFGGSSLYGVTPVTEERARKVAASCFIEPGGVHMPALLASESSRRPELLDTMWNEVDLDHVTQQEADDAAEEYSPF